MYLLWQSFVSDSGLSFYHVYRLQTSLRILQKCSYSTNYCQILFLFCVVSTWGLYLSAQDSVLLGLERPYVVPGIKFSLTTYRYPLTCPSQYYLSSSKRWIFFLSFCLVKHKKNTDPMVRI